MKRPVLLYNDECAVCRAIAGWVVRSLDHGEPALDVIPIGDDPAALRALDPQLDIWDAYATIHLLMPDGTTKRGGEAVAEVLRRVPSTRWFTPAFAVGIFGFRPFQAVLDGGYELLADVRPLFGCESCGTSNPLVRSAAATIAALRSPFDPSRRPGRTRHRSPRTVRSA